MLKKLLQLYNGQFMDDCKFISFRFNHINIVSDMVRDVWHLEDSIKNKILLKSLCNAYVCHILSKSNYRYLLYKNNKPVSFLCARIEKNKLYFRYFYLFLCFLNLFIAEMFKHGRSIIKYQLGYNKMLEELYKKAGRQYDAELILFMTFSGYQNSGYGRQLINKFNKDFKDNGLKNIYLYTDNYCDYKMYERAGCKLVCKDSKNFIFTTDEFFQEIYLYEYVIKE